MTEDRSDEFLSTMAKRMGAREGTLARMYQLVSGRESSPFRILHDRQLALRWLEPEAAE